jgi:membrane-associated protease RseP (regulator of RpoE activity)
VDYLFEVFRHHDRVGGRPTSAIGKDAAEFRFFVESQITWDRAMAQALAGRLDGRGAGERALVVGIMGGGHVRGGFGVPHQLRDLGVDNISVLLPVDAGRNCAELKPGLADAVFAIPALRRDKPPPPRLGVRLEEAEEGVRLADVTAESLAEKSGLQRGDHIVSLAGVPVTRASNVIAAVRLQPAGTWLPLQVRRGDETLDLVIKFPPKP